MKEKSGISLFTHLSLVIIKIDICLKGIKLENNIGIKITEIDIFEIWILKNAYFQKNVAILGLNGFSATVLALSRIYC